MLDDPVVIGFIVVVLATVGIWLVVRFVNGSEPTYNEHIQDMDLLVVPSTQPLAFVRLQRLRGHAEKCAACREKYATRIDRFERQVQEMPSSSFA